MQALSSAGKCDPSFHAPSSRESRGQGYLQNSVQGACIVLLRVISVLTAPPRLFSVYGVLHIVVNECLVGGFFMLFYSVLYCEVMSSPSSSKGIVWYHLFVRSKIQHIKDFVISVQPGEQHITNTLPRR